MAETKHTYTEPVYEVATERDVHYATAPGYWSHAPLNKPGALLLQLFQLRLQPIPLEMDIYLPKGDFGKRPLLLMMHGGSFLIGQKEEPGQAAWCQYFASLGYVAVSINYRLGFHLRKKEFLQAEIRALEDADAALEYLLLRRDDLHIDPSRVFVAGTSAGAITALNLAFRLYGGETVEAITPRLGKDFHIRAVGNLWGSVHDLSVLENADVPLLSFQSVQDPVVPYEEGYPLKAAGFLSSIFSDKMYGTHAIHQKALTVGLRSEHHPVPEARHRLHLDDKLQFTPRFYEIQEAMAVFFASEMV